MTQNITFKSCQKKCDVYFTPKCASLKHHDYKKSAICDTKHKKIGFKEIDQNQKRLVQPFSLSARQFRSKNHNQDSSQHGFQFLSNQVSSTASTKIYGFPPQSQSSSWWVVWLAVFFPTILACWRENCSRMRRAISFGRSPSPLVIIS